MSANPNIYGRFEGSVDREPDQSGDAFPQADEAREIETTLIQLREAIGASHTVHLIEVFLKNSRAQVEEVVDSVVRKSAPDLRRTAHQLKGSCSQVGASRLTDFCGKLEEAGAASQWQGVDALAESLALDFERVCNLLNRFKRSS